MAMNFWEAQRRARSRTTLYVIIFVLLTLLVAYISEEVMRNLAQESYDPPLPYVGLMFLAITFCVALFQYLMFRSQGGAYVAESLGARLVEKHSASPREQMLLNIVEEVALASSVPIPAVYILDANEINAFAAGMHPENAVVTVTKGTLALLSRDELQGVVAHEFGHIHNGDMLISMRMAAMVMGFFCVLYLAMRLLQVANFRGQSRDDNRKGGNPLVLAALILMIAGAFTWFAGSVLKSMISREREYLADACAVQFTRNPDGIANALRKIANQETHKASDMPKSGIAYSHMYFEDRTMMSFLFATHPPIEKRIAAIEGRDYIPKEWHIPPSNGNQEKIS